MAFTNFRKYSIARATGLAIALLGTTLACNAQSAVESVGMGKTKPSASIAYTTCDGSSWTAQYVGNIAPPTNSKRWRHTSSSGGEVRESDFILHLEFPQKCMRSELALAYLTMTGGQFFSTCNTANCSNTTTFSQSLAISIDPSSLAPTHVQLDAIDKSLLTLIPEANPPAGRTFVDSMEYKTCDGSVWRMSYAHLQLQNPSGTVVVSHTPVSNPGPSHFDNRIAYLNQDGTACYVQLFNTSSQGVVVKFLGGEGERYSWTIPGPLANVQKSFQGFLLTRQ